MASSRRRSSATQERENTSRRSTSRRSRDADVDEEDEEDEAPRARRSRRASGEDEDEAPRSRRSRARDEDDDEEQDERPSRRRRSRGDDDRGSRRASGRGGWGGAERNKSALGGGSGNYVDREDVWKPHSDFQLVKFVDDEPFVSYAQHWVNSAPKGRKGWECIAPLPFEDMDTDDYGREGDCPLCEELSESPRLKVLFHVLVLNDEDRDADPFWEYKVLECGVTLSDQLENLNDSRHGPLSKHYWEMSATGTKGSYSPNVQVVKDRDLDEEWGIEPLTDDDIDDLMEAAYDADVVSYPTLENLEDLVDEMANPPSRSGGGRGRRR